MLLRHAPTYTCWKMWVFFKTKKRKYLNQPPPKKKWNLGLSFKETRKLKFSKSHQNNPPISKTISQQLMVRFSMLMHETFVKFSDLFEKNILKFLRLNCSNCRSACSFYFQPLFDKWNRIMISHTFSLLKV